MGIAAAIRRSVEKRGIGGTSGLAMRLAMSALSGRLLAKYLRGRASHRSDLEFDARHGVETAGEVRSSDLRTNCDSKLFAAAYQPIDATWFRDAVALLGIRHEDYTFIDLGCGKGRALLLAAEFPFRRMVGVEFDPVLAGIATANIARHPATAPRAADIEVLCEDAASYDFPPGPILLYMYNPFEAPVMAKVADSVRRSLAREPRELVLVYFTPACTQPWDEVGALSRVDGSVDPAIYTNHGSTGTAGRA